MKARDVARFGILTAAALVLGYIERFIPIAVGVPGVKLGLSNTVLLYALYLMNVKSAFFLMILKVLLSGFLFGSVSAMLYAFAGGLLSLVMMILARKIPGISVVGVSVTGAVFHNVGQMAVAALMVNTVAIMSYLPVLLISGVITGIVTGLIAHLVIRALAKGAGQ